MQTETAYEVRGGACFIDHARYMVPDPLAVLFMTPTGVGVDLRPGLFKAFTVGGMRHSRHHFNGAVPWSADWSSCAGARFAGETVVLEDWRGDRVRFIAPSSAMLDPFRTALAWRGVRTAEVRSTFLDVYINRRWPPLTRP